ncbi:MAG: AEC family transporter [Candidatus Accumulibacter sp.]|uniref:AEC family transporter n=1 Tax=Accumulibacter sp. TaxID=2053492 RepID=UPI001A032E00|nr:AEC family transporter [Accumulibacter sp.]MBE2258503.1 AEC family transporter [Paracoccaceae bacterium]MCB1943529.1 AEC family transporter [Accumulibacter sp.]MCP5249957.1 AEC family transporter [Accumulibacter sp.]
MQGILLLLPDFGLILLGWVLYRLVDFADSFWSGLEKLVYFVLFPALLFRALASTPIDFLTAAPLFASGAAALACGVVLGLLGAPLFGAHQAAFASRFQCAFRFNSYIGLAVIGKLHGATGIATMGILIGAMVPLANVASVWMLARHGNLGVLREMARNPLLLATLAGFLYSSSGLTLPTVAAQLLGRLSEAAVALGLLAVGAALKLRGSSGSHLASCYLLAVKLLAVPAAGLLAAASLGLSGVYFDTVIVFAALPTATSAYILAVRMGGDGPGVAWLVSANTLLAMLTLPVWLTVALRH